MKIERQYVLTRIAGEPRWYLWEGNGFMECCKYILYAGDDPVTLVEKLFKALGAEEKNDHE